MCYRSCDSCGDDVPGLLKSEMRHQETESCLQELQDQSKGNLVTSLAERISEMQQEYTCSICMIHDAIAIHFKYLFHCLSLGIPHCTPCSMASMEGLLTLEAKQQLSEESMLRRGPRSKSKNKGNGRNLSGLLPYTLRLHGVFPWKSRVSRALFHAETWSGDFSLQWHPDEVP